MFRFALVLVVPAIFLGCEAPPVEPEGPTYSADVAPILQESCVSCHRTAGIAPFKLDSYEAVSELAEAIAATTGNRTMPPNLVDNGGDCETYQNARWLDDDAIATLAAWADNGAPQGDETFRPEPFEPPAQLVADLVIDMGVDHAPQPSPGSPEDEYRCFVVEPGIDTTRFVTGFEVVPGDDRVVHHVVMFRPEGGAAATARNRDGEDGRPGYPCFGGAGVQASVVMAWAPGTFATQFPVGTGIRLNPGQPLILQMHYNLANGAFEDRTSVLLQTRDSVVREAFFTFVGDFNFALPPGEPSVSIAGTQSLLGSIPNGGMDVWAVFPHMHTLGTSMRLSVQDQERCLSDVPRWDFGWQQFFFYDQPVNLTPADIMRVDCSYDTTNRTTTTRFGEGTADEMCIFGLYVTF